MLRFRYPLFHVRVLALALVCSLLFAAHASAQNYTWQGGGSSAVWSESANWLGGEAPAPGSSIGTVSLPVLPSPGSTDNNVSGLSLEQLQINDTNDIGLMGEGFTLGSGGLSITANPTETTSSPSFEMFPPITLGSSQTWTLSGPLNVTQTVEAIGALSGSAADLTINATSPTILNFGGALNPTVTDDEVGNVTINGTGLGGEGAAFTGTLVQLDRAKLNASDGKRLTVNNAYLEAGQATGPLTGHEALLELSGGGIGPVVAESTVVRPIGVLGLDGLSLDSASAVTVGLDGTGTVAGTDFNQVAGSGALDLGGAALELVAKETVPFSGQCERPTVGTVATIVSTSGSLSGTFGNAPESGTVITNECFIPTGGGSEAAAFSYRIDYHRSGSPETVTATVLPSVPVMGLFSQPPSISGTAEQGQVLSETHADWLNSPTSYSYQWLRCDSTGGNCAAIAGAIVQPYTLNSADVGSTLRVQETASNGEGTSSPSVSVPSALVGASPAPKEEAKGGGSSGSGISGGSGSGVVPTTGVSTAQIVASLKRQLVPSGKATKIGELLKHGGLSVPFTAPEAGALVVQWYYVPVGAKLAKRSKVKPVLVASGRLTFSGAGAGKVKVRLTGAGRRVLRHGGRVKLTIGGEFVPVNGAAVNVTKALLIRR
jgi:hypothetical protein